MIESKMNLMSSLQSWKISLEWFLHNSTTIRQGDGPKINWPWGPDQSEPWFKTVPRLSLPLGSGLTVPTWTPRRWPPFQSYGFSFCFWNNSSYWHLGAFSADAVPSARSVLTSPWPLPRTFRVKPHFSQSYFSASPPLPPLQGPSARLSHTPQTLSALFQNSPGSCPTSGFSFLLEVLTRLAQCMSPASPQREVSGSNCGLNSWLPHRPRELEDLVPFTHT